MTLHNNNDDRDLNSSNRSEHKTAQRTSIIMRCGGKVGVIQFMKNVYYTFPVGSVNVFCLINIHRRHTAIVNEKHKIHFRSNHHFVNHHNIVVKRKMQVSTCGVVYHSWLFIYVCISIFFLLFVIKTH